MTPQDAGNTRAARRGLSRRAALDVFGWFPRDGRVRIAPNPRHVGQGPPSPAPARDRSGNTGSCAFSPASGEPGSDNTTSAPPHSAGSRGLRHLGPREHAASGAGARPTERPPRRRPNRRGPHQRVCLTKRPPRRSPQQVLSRSAPRRSPHQEVITKAQATAKRPRGSARPAKSDERWKEQRARKEGRQASAARGHGGQPAAGRTRPGHLASRERRTYCMMPPCR